MNADPWGCTIHDMLLTGGVYALDKSVISAIDTEISRLQEAKRLLTLYEPFGGKAKANRKKRVLSPEARARIAAAQKRRWAKRRALK
jgi:hypothetical protein